MDIADLTEEQVQLAIKLAQILSLEDIKESISILSSFKWDIERVLGSIDLNDSTLKRQEKRQQENEHKQEKAKEHKKPAYEKVKNQSQSQIHEIASRNIRNDKKERKASREFVQSNDVMAERNLRSQQVQANKFFLSHITQKYHPLLDFAFNDFHTNLQRSFNEKKYLLVYVHIIDTERYYDQSIQEIMIDKKIANFTNKHCIVYGIIGGSEDYDNIKEYLPQKVQPIFALFKFDHIHSKEQFVSHYQPQEEQLSILEWLFISTDNQLSQKIMEKEKEKKKENMKRQLQHWEHFDDEEFKEEEKVKESKLKDMEDEENEKHQKAKHQKSYVQESIISQGISSISDKIKDIDIKQEQDNAYKKLEKSYIRKKNLSNMRHQEIKEKEEELKKRQKEAENNFTYVLGDCASIKFRMPNGAILLHKFNPTDKIEKIFAYVDIFCREHFQEKFNDFNLSTTFSPLVFNEAKGQTIDKALEGEKRITINVKQI